MSPTQSWAAWLLDSYASSVSPMPTDSHFRHHDDTPSISDDSYSIPTDHSSTQSPMSTISNSSAYGPYVRTGRGGAGNFSWQTEPKPVRSSSPIDLEAQPIPQSSLGERRKAAAKLGLIDTKEAARMRQISAQYLSTGRGGVGNFASNNAITSAKRSPSLPASFSPKTVSPPNSHSQHPGRGGAGNYAAAAEANGRTETEREEEERIAAEQRREQIIEEVDGLLQPPPGAFLGSGRRKSESMFDHV
ncbi:uncharacterized protein Z518_05668 [Rhinocladiella mackenziei CBS 650.93]|uniref:Uncharacterized protein n=1 Tax=Rhinocladiella mackenziei CBS 650.93 TaxID=1442369 RepID=A0A0D2FRJ5_9EURO|nr:uncharacterized protein Z518_05668 [Rhinocladiella mackenziei CBS 650.93]KIX04797.1 hypothetical protein Z518_05668 [Rhinocladiella mackenziei CBS 650.93]